VQRQNIVISLLRVPGSIFEQVCRKIAIAGDGFGARAAALEADDGVPGSHAQSGPSLNAAAKGEEQRSEELECTPKVRQEIKGPITLNGGEQCLCPDNSIPAN
jgi:hypothetical protein